MVTFSLCLVLSCSENEDTNQISHNNLDLNAINVENGIVKISSKQYLNQIVTSYKSGVEGQNKFNDKIKSLQKNGFKPLTPIFDGLSDAEIKEFVIRKKERVQQRNVMFGLSARNSMDYELDLDDDLIKDPVFAALLNEEREIIIEDELYKYTELGMFKIDFDEKQVLTDYLDSITPMEKRALILQYKNEYSTTNKPQEVNEDLGSGLTTFRIKAVDLLRYPYPSNTDYDGGEGGSSGSSSGGTTSTMGNGVYDPTTFGGCTIESQGFFEGIFGVSEACTEYYNDNRRVKVTFWNQNFLVFSSIGASTRLQKRECMNFLWMSICWWEKSYAESIKLGINNVTFKYDFNVPVFNLAEYNYSTTFFEYNGTKYNINGQVIPTVPTSAGSFNFPVNNSNNVIDITILGNNVALNNGQVNQVIDGLLNQIIGGIQSFGLKQELLAKKAAGTLEVRAVYAVPFSNYVKFIIAKQNWGANNDNSVVHYFDFNMLFSYNSNNNYNPTTGSGAINILQGLNGATSYTEVKADLFGAALHNNFWKGRRLFTTN